MRLSTLLAAALLIAAGAAHAQAVAPFLLPSATDSVRVTLYVGSDRALVRETCRVHLPAGRSDLQFRWTEAAVDAASVALHGPEDVTVGMLRRPAGDAKALSWPLEVAEAGEREFTTLYFITGLKWAPMYELTLDPAAGNASLVGTLQLTNDSKLPLAGAHVELTPPPVGTLEALEGLQADEPVRAYASWESVSLEPGWVRRMGFLRAHNLPFRILYRADPEAFRQEVRKFLRVDLRNLPVPGALPVGSLIIRERLGDGRRLPVTTAELRHVTDGETEVALGVEPDILYQRTVVQRRKTDVEFDRFGRVSGYDNVEEVLAIFRNRLEVPVQVDLTERVAGKWTFTAQIAPTARRDNALEWSVALAPHERTELQFRVVRRTGSRAE